MPKVLAVQPSQGKAEEGKAVFSSSSPSFWALVFRCATSQTHDPTLPAALCKSQQAELSQPGGICGQMLPCSPALQQPKALPDP